MEELLHYAIETSLIFTDSIFVFARLFIIYPVDIVNNIRSAVPRVNNGISDTNKLYTIHSEDDAIFITENNSEYRFVDFFVYNKYINTNLPKMEIAVAE